LYQTIVFIPSDAKRASKLFSFSYQVTSCGALKVFLKASRTFSFTSGGLLAKLALANSNTAADNKIFFMAEGFIMNKYLLKYTCYTKR